MTVGNNRRPFGYQRPDPDKVAEPQNEDESGDEPGKREVEGAVDEASTKDGEGSSTP